MYKVKRLSDGQVYALKKVGELSKNGNSLILLQNSKIGTLFVKVKMGKLSDKEKENALNEVRILASIE